MHKAERTQYSSYLSFQLPEFGRQQSKIRETSFLFADRAFELIWKSPSEDNCGKPTYHLLILMMAATHERGGVADNIDVASPLSVNDLYKGKHCSSVMEHMLCMQYVPGPTSGISCEKNLKLQGW